jgi:hypothetical protein
LPGAMHRICTHLTDDCKTPCWVRPNSTTNLFISFLIWETQGCAELHNGRAECLLVVFLVVAE